MLPLSQQASEKEGLLDSVLPPPTHPRARPRALATSAVAIFFLLAVWMACTAQTPRSDAVDAKDAVQQALPQSWTWSDGVIMDSYDESQASSYSETQAQESEDPTANDDEDASESDADADQDLEEQARTGFAKYIWHKDLEWDAEGNGRLIVVGDVHGMYEALKLFLAELEYSPKQTARHNDTLVFVGDLVAKHPSIKSNLETLKYIRSLNAWAVRGNHDQDVLNWRKWMETSSTFQGLASAEDDLTAVDASTEPEQPPADVPQTLKHKWRDEHFRIAKQMSQASADWLALRSMTLHIRSLHTYVVHAGLLPWTIPKNRGKKKLHTQENEEPVNVEFLQDLDFTNEFGITPETSLLESADPTSFVPVTPQNAMSLAAQDKDLDPEMAILTVPLNTEPFTLLEMRGLKKNGKVTKSSSKGEPWAPIWNYVMKGCQQTITDQGEVDADSVVDSQKMKPGQCRPLSVIYGHAAARGLDLHAYSFGLDSGAVYGRSFSALVVEGAQRRKQGLAPLKSEKLVSIDVAISGRNAKVYSMKTAEP